MIFEEQKIKGVYVIRPRIYIDSRGYFFETFKNLEFEENLKCNFVQDNEVFSSNIKTLRGLHYQLKNPQAKLVRVVSGAVKDVIIDIRNGSNSFGESFSINLSHNNRKMLFVPEGFAHGYLVLEQNTIVQYKCTDYYNSNAEYGIRWDDKDLNINWGVKNPILSYKDRNLPFLKDQKMLPKI